MTLQRLTITGADDAVDPQALADLSREFPFVEWGILMSATRKGTPRYPSDEWIERLLAVRCDRALGLPLLQLAAHVCGRRTKEVLEGTWMPPQPFTRVQLNGYEPCTELPGNTRRHFILQCRREEDLPRMIDYALDDGRASILFDASGGRGIAPDAWPLFPYALHTTEKLVLGFAGGIKPETFNDTVRMITHHGYYSTPSYWLDLESGVRTDDRFDLAKVRDVLEHAVHAVNRRLSHG